MGSIRGRRKAILMFSEGIDYPILDVFDSRDASTILSDTRDAIASASKANVNFYTIDPRGLHAMGDENMELGGFPADPSYNINPQAFEDERRLAVDSLKVLAEQTGGFAAVESNDYSDAYDRIVRENSSYYVLGYYPPSNKRDGKFHKIEVKLKRPGLKVTARKGYAAPKGKGEVTAVDPSAGTSTALKDLLNSPLQQPGLTLSVVAAPFDAPKDNVAVTIEIVGRNLKFTPDKGLFTNTVEVSMLPLEARGKAQQGRRSEVKLNLKPQTAQVMAATAVRLVAAPDAAAGTLPAARRGQGDGRHDRIGVLRPDGAGLHEGEVQHERRRADRRHRAGHADGRAGSDPQADAARAADDAAGVLPDRRPGALRRGLRQAADRRAAHGRRDDAPGVRDRQGSRRAPRTRARATSSRHAKGVGFFGYSTQVPLADVAPGRYMLQVEAKARIKDAPAVRREMLITIVQPPPDLVRPAAKPGVRTGLATPAAAEADAESLLGLSPRAAAVLAWGGAWVTGGLVCWLAPDGARFVRHHARHALWVTGGVTALALGLWFLGILAAFLVTPTAFAVVSWLATGAWFGVLPFWLWGLIRAIRGETLRMPGVTRRIEGHGDAVAASAAAAPSPDPVLDPPQ